MEVVEDDELAKHDKEKTGEMQLEEKGVTHSLLEINDTRTGETKVWYLDNGASNHMTSFKGKFTELNQGVTGQVHFGDDSSVKIEGKGTVRFVCKN